MDDKISRRKMILSSGAIGAVSLAGCLGDSEPLLIELVNWDSDSYELTVTVDDLDFEETYEIAAGESEYIEDIEAEDYFFDFELENRDEELTNFHYIPLEDCEEHTLTVGLESEEITANTGCL